MWLIKSIHQRQRTIYKVMESVIKHQRPFFERGVNHLRPLNLRQLQFKKWSQLKWKVFIC